MTPIDTARIRRFTVAGLLILGLSTAFTQRLSLADPSDQDTARFVARLIPQFHFGRGDINDAVSSKLLDGFIQQLDPNKLFFLQSDLNEFESRRNSLDDEIKAGNVSFCYLVFDRFKARSDAQMTTVLGMIRAEYDFTVDETIELDSKKLKYAANQQELNDRWRKRIKFDLLNQLLDKKTTEEAQTQLERRYRTLKLANNQFTDSEELEVYLTVLAQCFDPHSAYMSPATSEEFNIQMRLSLDGIGAALRSEDGETIVANVVEGGAAFEEGTLKAKDRVLGVAEGANGEFVAVQGKRLSDVVKMIRGRSGTIVRLKITSGNDDEFKVISLTRKKIMLKEDEVKGEIIETQERIGRPGKIGILNVPSYYMDFDRINGSGKRASADIEREIKKFEAANVDLIIFDQRSNGGGSLEEAVTISGMFIDRGPVVQTREPGQSIKVLEDRSPGVLTTKPLVVLNNHLSASASEIFAGVIHDYKRGIIVGDSTTHGKGTVQSVIDVAPRQPFSLLGKSNDYGKLKITIQQFYRVNGVSTQQVGVKSDIVLPSLIDHLEIGESSLKGAMLADTIAPVKYSVGNMTNPETIAQLQLASENRIRQIPDFKKVNDAIARYLEKKERTESSLNLETARQERHLDEAIETKSEEERELMQGEPKSGSESGTKKPVELFPKRFYEDEVLNISLDYLEALKAQVASSRR